MIRHYIILSSSYSMGKRIGMHYILDCEGSFQIIIEDISKIKSRCGDTVSISTHFITTDSTTWESIEKKDGFFEQVHVTENIEDFIQLIMIDRKLKGIDIAKYILSQFQCTHLKLEKLVYLCYADYLCSTKKRLFEDEIYAFKFGPVVDSVYDKYKGTRTEIQELEVMEEHLVNEQFAYMPAQSRILFAEHGIEKLSSINATLKKYKDYSASRLVDITHKQGGPWDRTDKTEKFSLISDEIIKQYH